ncbi:hypothetical protein PRIPAC_82724, partial [Pristionchus pacificus]|uniref:Esterase n=1 Tax=Pristionchus pacificus TaxID=54126 RepID=A0A2A6CJE2_PRIPA
MGNRQSCPDSRIVETSCGKVQGRRLIYKGERQVEAFQGIPFAKPPVGKLRFKKPEPPEKWDGIKETKKFGPRAIVTPFVNGFVENLLVTRGVVFITIQYRLGYLGFLSTGDAACPGNNGLWDQTAALRWVNDNIEAFGGNKNNITLLGQSAGGASVDLLHLSPHSTNLFHKVIPMAGNAECRWATNKNMPQQCRNKAARLGITSYETSEELLDKLRALPAEKFAVNFRNREKEPDVNLETVPILDGDFFPESIDEMRKKAKPKPLMTGVCTEEGLFFIPGKKPTEQDLNEVVNFAVHEAKDRNAIAADLKSVYLPDGIPADKDVFMRSIANIASDYFFNAGTIELCRKTVALQGLNTTEQVTPHFPPHSTPFAAPADPPLSIPKCWFGYNKPSSKEWKQLMEFDDEDAEDIMEEYLSNSTQTSDSDQTNSPRILLDHRANGERANPGEYSELIKHEKNIDRFVLAICPSEKTLTSSFGTWETKRLRHEAVYLYQFEHFNPKVMGFAGRQLPIQGRTESRYTEFHPKQFFSDATHASELIYLFKKGLFTLTEVSLTDEDKHAMHLFTTAFTNFAKYGDPNGSNDDKSDLDVYWKPLDKMNHSRNFVFASVKPYMSDQFFEGRIAQFVDVVNKHRAEIHASSYPSSVSMDMSHSRTHLLPPDPMLGTRILSRKPTRFRCALAEVKTLTLTCVIDRCTKCVDGVCSDYPLTQQSTTSRNRKRAAAPEERHSQSYSFAWNCSTSRYGRTACDGTGCTN